MTMEDSKTIAILWHNFTKMRKRHLFWLTKYFFVFLLFLILLRNQLEVKFSNYLIGVTEKMFTKNVEILDHVTKHPLKNGFEALPSPEMS